MNSNPLILVGGGGHCRSSLDVIEQTGNFQVAGIVDLPERVGEKVLGYPIIGTDDDLEDLGREYQFLITIGQIRSAKRRTGLFRRLCGSGLELATVISPLAYVSRHAHIGMGTIVMHHAVINAGAAIGKNCIINTRSVVEHDVVISDHCHVSTGAIVNGGVRIGSEVFFGSGAVARESIRIGAGSFVGANQTVTMDLPEGSVFK